MSAARVRPSPLALLLLAGACAAAPAQPLPPPKAPDPAKPEVKPEAEYPKFVEGRDLDAWLKEVNPLNQRDAQVREAAVRVIPLFGPKAREKAIKPLIDAIRGDPDPGVRIVSMMTVGHMGMDLRAQTKPAVTALRNCIQTTAPGSVLRLYSVKTLGLFGIDADDAVAETKFLVTDASWETRQATAVTLGMIGQSQPDPKDPAKKRTLPNLSALTQLHKLLADDSAAVRLAAAQALLNIGPPPVLGVEQYVEDVKPFLEPLLLRLPAEKKRADKSVYLWLLLLQMMYDDQMAEPNVKALAKAIAQPDGENVTAQRQHALAALTLIGPKAAPALPQVIDALSYDEPEVVAAAIGCLANIGNPAGKAVDPLDKIRNGSKDQKPPENALKDWKPDPTLRLMAGEAIDLITGKKKPGDPPAKPK